MPYLNCPSCGLILATWGSGPTIEHCPRCRMRRRQVVAMCPCDDPSAKPRPRSIAKPASSDVMEPSDAGATAVDALRRPRGPAPKDSHATG
jgi:hypothetical protein